MCLARNIRYLRKKANMSQEDIAKRLGYKSFTTIQKWESGVAEPPVIVVRKLAELFDVDMNSLTTQDIEKSEDSTYYTNPKTARMAQEIFESKELSMLFDVSKGMSPEDLNTVYQMALSLKRKERYEE